MKKTKTILLAGGSLLMGATCSQAATLAIDSGKESFIREDGANTNQGQARLLMGSQGSGTEFRLLLQFELDDLVTATSGGAITINSVNLDLGDAFNWSGIANSSSFQLREWAVTDFNVFNNTWNDPQGTAGADSAGGSLGTVLSTETFNDTIAEGAFNFGTDAAFVSYLQTAYNSDTASGATLNLIAVTNTPNVNGFIRTDDGSVNGIGTADLNIDYTVTVPEPSSTALLGLGGLALMLRRRK